MKNRKKLLSEWEMKAMVDHETSMKYQPPKNLVLTPEGWKEINI